MPAKIIDGRAHALQLRANQKQRAEKLERKLGRSVGLGVILVGDDAASQIYVRNKARFAEKIGVRSRIVTLPETVTQRQLLDAVETFNQDANIDAFLVQFPLPRHLDSNAIIAAIAPNKDADGLHPLNIASLALGQPGVLPCTPSGCLYLLQAEKIPIAGKHAVILGRSQIVGRPMAQMLLNYDATVTVCHSQTQNLHDYVKQADILIAATGQAHLVQGDWIQQGATVIDVGIHRTPQGLLGDVDFEQACRRAAAITPVPGGVGPMTVAMLMENTLNAAAQ